jgi:hypothetical protein
MSLPEFSWVPLQTINIKIGTIEERGKPRVLQDPCKPKCGGMLNYTQGSHIMDWDGNHVEVESVWAYRCSNNCGVIVFLEEVGAVIERHIGEAWAKVGRVVPVNL